MSKPRNKYFVFNSGKILRVTHIRDRNLTEGRIYPKTEFHRMPAVPKCGLNTRHDNREVTLTHLTQAQILRSDKRATGSIHTNGSMTINVIPC